jgi:hypothetical protein
MQDLGFRTWDLVKDMQDLGFRTWDLVKDIDVTWN